LPDRGLWIADVQRRQQITSNLGQKPHSHELGGPDTEPTQRQRQQRRVHAATSHGASINTPVRAAVRVIVFELLLPERGGRGLVDDRQAGS
jgi:hypothetical protein